MRHFLIDGNNLLGKLSVKENNFRPVNPGSRELLLTRLTEHFRGRKDEVTLFYDGHEKDKLRSGRIRIIYSNSKAADLIIREKIEKTKNRKNLVVVSSDNEIKNFARVCSCEIVLSETFAGEISSKKTKRDEADQKQDPAADKEYFIKLFSSGSGEKGKIK